MNNTRSHLETKRAKSRDMDRRVERAVRSFWNGLDDLLEEEQFATPATYRTRPDRNVWAWVQ